MITFAYQARDASGRIVSGIQDALNEDNAVTSLMTWSAGTAALTGRFPLGRLTFVTPSAAAASASDIQKYFGLKWQNGTRGSAGTPPTPAVPGHWQYIGSNGSTMQSNIPAFTKDPEFFQLLNYAIQRHQLRRFNEHLHDAIARSSDHRSVR